MVSMDKWGEILLTFCTLAFLKTSLLCHNYRQTKFLDLNKCLTVYSSHNDEVLFFLVNVLEKKLFDRTMYCANSKLFSTN